MQDIQPMKVLHSFTKLPNNVNGRCLVESFLSFHYFIELALGSKLHEQVNVVDVLEKPVEASDVRVRQA
jgi:hypothetical protein